MQNKLKPGHYMKTTSVLRFVSKWFPSQILNVKVLEKHRGEYDVYFKTEDLKFTLSNDIFREMECDVTTHVILSDEDLAQWNKH